MSNSPNIIPSNKTTPCCDRAGERLATWWHRRHWATKALLLTLAGAAAGGGIGAALSEASSAVLSGLCSLAEYTGLTTCNVGVAVATSSFLSAGGSATLFAVYSGAKKVCPNPADCCEQSEEEQTLLSVVSVPRYQQSSYSPLESMGIDAVKIIHILLLKEGEYKDAVKTAFHQLFNPAYIKIEGDPFADKNQTIKIPTQFKVLIKEHIVEDEKASEQRMTAKQLYDFVLDKIQTAGINIALSQPKLLMPTIAATFRS